MYITWILGQLYAIGGPLLDNCDHFDKDSFQNTYVVALSMHRGLFLCTTMSKRVLFLSLCVVFVVCCGPGFKCDDFPLFFQKNQSHRPLVFKPIHYFHWAGLVTNGKFRYVVVLSRAVREEGLLFSLLHHFPLTLIRLGNIWGISFSTRREMCCVGGVGVGSGVGDGTSSKVVVGVEIGAENPSPSTSSSFPSSMKE